MHKYMYIYTHVYTFVNMCVYICIYIYMCHWHPGGQSSAPFDSAVLARRALDWGRAVLWFQNLAGRWGCPKSPPGKPVADSYGVMGYLSINYGLPSGIVA